MKVFFSPSLAKGSVRAPGSKSVSHRALIAASLAKGESVIGGMELSQDILATADCLRALGAKIDLDPQRSVVFGVGGVKAVDRELYCRESGSTLRFCLPLALLTGSEHALFGSRRLLDRPLDVYEALAREKGFRMEKKEECWVVQGPLEPGEYAVSGSVSSQFITGLLFALSSLEGECVVRLTTPLESASYLDLTLSVMEEFGVSVEKKEDSFLLRGSRRYLPRHYEVEADWSNAAFLDAFTSVGGSVSVLGLKEDSQQGDRAYREIIPLLETSAPTVDLSNIPDLGPILIALAAYHNGATFVGTRRLRIKESDRGEAMAQELKKCGVTVTVEENRIVVPGGQLQPPKEAIDSLNDHRIVMAMSVLLSRLGGVIKGAEAVNKSFPDFFDRIKSLGIEVKQDETESKLPN